MDISPTQMEAQIAQLRRGIWALIDQDEPLEKILARLIENIEAQADTMLAAIFFYDPASNQLTVGSAPHLQPAYQKAMNGFPVGPSQPACGSAAFKREPVISEDVTQDPLWGKLGDFANGLGIRAVWSQPIFGEAGEVLGTVAFYFPVPKKPDAADLIVLEASARIAAHAIRARKSQAKAMIRARAGDRLPPMVQQQRPSDLPSLPL